MSFNRLKLVTADIIADTLYENNKLKRLFRIVCRHTKCSILYAIKKKGDKRIIEIYFHYLPRFFLTGMGEYHRQVMSILTEFRKDLKEEIHCNILKYISDNYVGLVAYEFDADDLSLLRCFDVYRFSETLRYNLDDTTLKLTSNFKPVCARDLRSCLIENCNINNDIISDVMDELLRVVPTLETTSHIVMFHEKLYKDTLGIYLNSLDFDILKLFVLERFNKVLSNESGVFTGQYFGVYFNFSLTDGKVTGFGVYDHF
jgi:hypothetical protein